MLFFQVIHDQVLAIRIIKTPNLGAFALPELLVPLFVDFSLGFLHKALVGTNCSLAVAVLKVLVHFLLSELENGVPYTRQPVEALKAVVGLHDSEIRQKHKVRNEEKSFEDDEVNEVLLVVQEDGNAKFADLVAFYEVIVVLYICSLALNRICVDRTNCYEIEECDDDCDTS